MKRLTGSSHSKTRRQKIWLVSEQASLPNHRVLADIISTFSPHLPTSSFTLPLTSLPLTVAASSAAAARSELLDLPSMSAPLPALWGWVAIKGRVEWGRPALVFTWSVEIIAWTDKVSPFYLRSFTWTFLDPVLLIWAAVYCNNSVTEFNRFIFTSVQLFPNPIKRTRSYY